MIAKTTDELSLLLFFETCFVDHGGILDSRHMNGDDMQIAAGWNKSGFIKFERICSEDLNLYGHKKSHVVWLSDEAMTEAHAERRARAIRCNADRKRRTISEFRDQQQ